MGKVTCLALSWGLVLVMSCFNGHNIYVNGELTNEERQEFLDIHNKYRQDVSPTATNMKRMKWNFDLELTAAMWADNCVYEHGDPICTDAPYPSTGQNLFASTGSPTPEKAVTAWKDEVNDYTYDTMVCAEGKQCGHYTQVAWAESYEVGCAMTECSPLGGPGWEKGYLVVCNYGPPGNFVGQKLYKEGDSCSECGDLVCEAKLCVDKSLNYTIPLLAQDSGMRCNMGGSGKNDTAESNDTVGDKSHAAEESSDKDKESDADIDAGSTIIKAHLLLLLTSIGVIAKITEF